MFKKELVDVLKQTGWFLAASLVLAGALPVFRVVPRQPYTAVLVPVLQVGLMFWGLFLGASVFGRERRQRAMEYALSLPYSRRALLVRLAGARLIVLAGLWILSVIAALLWIKSPGTEDALWLGTVLALFSLVLFTVALSLAPVIENFIALCLVSIVVWFSTIPLILLVGHAFAWMRGWTVSALPRFSYTATALVLPSLYPHWLTYMPILLGILPFAAALYYSFPKFDLRPSAAYKKHFARVLAAGLAACLAGGFLTAALTYPNYIFARTITPDHKLVEFGDMGFRIRSSSGIQKIRRASVLGWPGSAPGGRVIYGDGETLLLLDVASGQSRLIYDSREGGPRVGLAWICGEYVLFLGEKGSRSASRTLHVISLDRSDARKYQSIHLSDEGAQSLRSGKPFGTGRRDDRRFWLFVSPHSTKLPLRIWQDGRVQEITDGRIRRIRDASYINDLAVFWTADEMLIFRDNGDSFELVKTVSGGFSFNTGWWDDLILDQPKAKVFYGIRGGKVAKLDLESLGITDISSYKLSTGASIYGFLPDRFYLVERIPADKILVLSFIKNDEILRLKEFPDFASDQPRSWLEVQRDGVLLHQGRRVTAYAFPDLSEIQY